MNFSITKVLKFLFPEYQIVDVVNNEGMTNIKARNTMKANTRQQTGFDGDNSAEDSSVFNPNQISNKVAPGDKSVSALNRRERIIKPEAVDEKFSDLNNVLSQELIASSEYVDSLCMAFKRPYVSGYDNVVPKNVIFILGPESTGRCFSVEIIAQILKSRRIFYSNSVEKIDLSRYGNTSDSDLFLSDIYKALYNQSDVVVFENYDQCHSANLRIISQLVQVGKYEMNKRYALQNNNLVEATGALITNSTDTLYSNGKFFVFISDKGANKITEVFGTSFAKCIGDIISINILDEEKINLVTSMLINKLIFKCRQQLKLIVKTDAAFKEKITQSYKPKKGIKGLKKYLDENVYKALSEYRLRNSTQTEENVMLSFDSVFKAIFNDREIVLSDYIKNYDNVAIESVREELNNIIGLDEVKDYVLNIEENLNVQQLRSAKGLKAADISMHMIFTGNPGTGKTTIARLVAKYLKAIGVLSSGQLREVSRADLVGQYVGQTAQLTKDVIESSVGGVLFIDEAYSLYRDKSDVFGIEAIDTLVKGIEDHRDDMVVIMAGYEKEMAEFLNTNPGLKSRFPNTVKFADYTASEMYQIALITAKNKGYVIDNACEKKLLELFEKSQIKGKNDSGNGRLVRNIIEKAILAQSKRVAKDHSANLELLTVADFGLDVTKKFDLEGELEKIIGLSEIKTFIRKQHKLLVAQAKRREADLEVDATQTLNMIFSGNPGTGKTTVARIVADMFKEMGVLKSGHLVETDKSGLVSEYVGQTSKKTEEIFKSALGGVLFIDEAYALTSGGSHGQEAIDTLVKLLEDYRGEILVILAGYEKEMNDFLKTNSGLSSRFPQKIHFPDYSVEELFQIGLRMIEGKKFRLADSSVALFKEQVSDLHKHSNVNSGNARMIRNYVEELIINQSARIATIDVIGSDLTAIMPEDIIVKNDGNSKFDLEKALGSVIGMDSVKAYIRKLNARLYIQEERRKMGLQIDPTQTMHMIFKGNPGTGKTTMARMVANVLYDMGIIKTNKLVETDRSGLVAGYVGQTAIKTAEVVNSALNGVLFIDEAYSLAQGGANDFGREAIDTLVKLMDDNRDRLVVILAGYSDNMDTFLAMNPGLKSRFANIIEFPDYSSDELVQIAENMYQNKGYVLDYDAKSLLRNIFERARQMSHFGNGRFVRNIMDKSINNQAFRLSKDVCLTKEELIKITADDIKGAVE